MQILLNVCSFLQYILVTYSFFFLFSGFQQCVQLLCMTMDVNGSKLQTAYVSCIAKTFLHLHCKSWHMKSVFMNV